MSTRKAVIIGLGYVGLPLALRAVEAGYVVIGLDLDESRIQQLRGGRSYLEDVPSEEVARAIADGRLHPTTDYADARGFDVAVIAVPTPLRESLPDLSFIAASGRSLAPFVTPGSLVVLESTTYPGTTVEVLVPALEEGSSLRAGADFQVGYSPERIDPGNTAWNIANTPKLVSGIDAGSLERVAAFYGELVEQTIPVSGTREAELAKLLENTFRHVNIALINEMAVFANQLGVDIWEAIRAASTKPFGYLPFTPGPGVGGHCLPVDPSFLSWEVQRKLGRTFRFVELANDINKHMPDYVVERLIALLNRRSKALNGARVVLVGLSYKPDSGDIRESPSLRVVELLHGYGARVVGVDPFVDDAAWPRGVERADLDEDLLETADAAVLLTNHSAFDLGLLAAPGVPVLDTRNAAPAGPDVERL